MMAFFKKKVILLLCIALIGTCHADDRPVQSMELYTLLNILIDHDKFYDLLSKFSNIEYSDPIRQAEGELVLLIDGKKLYPREYSKIFDKFYDGEFEFIINENDIGGYYFGIHQIEGYSPSYFYFHEYLNRFFDAELLHKKDNFLNPGKIIVNFGCQTYKIYKKNDSSKYIIANYNWKKHSHFEYSFSIFVASHRSSDELFCGDKVNIK